MSRVYDHRPLGVVGGSNPAGTVPIPGGAGPGAQPGIATPASAAAAAAQAAMSQASGSSGPNAGPGPSAAGSASNAVPGGAAGGQVPPSATPQGPPGAASMNASVARLTDLLEFVKAEFDQVIGESSVLKMQREEYETIISHHAAELNGMRIMSFELERKHLEEKRQLQDEISRLQDELHKHRPSSSTSGGSSLPPATSSATALAAIRPTSSNGLNQPRATLPPISSNRPSSSSAGPPYPFYAPQPHTGDQHQNGRDDLPHVHPNKRPRTTDEDSKSGVKAAKARTSVGKATSPAPNSPAHRPKSAQAYSPKSTAAARPATPETSAPVSAAASSASIQAPAAPPAEKQQEKPSNGAVRQGSAQPLPADTFDPETVARDLKKEGSDWMTVFNPNVKRVLDVGLVHTLVHDSVVCCVKFSPDGKVLATGCNKNTTLYDTKTGAKISVLFDDSGETHDNYIRSTSFSPDGKLVATGSEDKLIRIWNIAQRRIIKVLKGHKSEIYSLAFSPDGKRLVSGSGDKTAMIWDVESGTCLHTLPVDEGAKPSGAGEGPPDAGVTSVVLSPDGVFLAAGSLDMVVRIWDARSGKLIERLTGHKDSVYSVAFSPDGKFLVSASLDKTLKMWDVASLRQAVDAAGTVYRPGDHKVSCMTTLQGHKDYVLSVAVSPDGQWIVSGSKDRGVQFWDPVTAKAQFMLQGHKNSVISVAVSDAGGLVATGSGDWSARIWSYSSV